MTEPIALVFGNEHSGVSDEIRALADGNFIIPQVGIIRSLNISVACETCDPYEAYRQKRCGGTLQPGGYESRHEETVVKLEWLRYESRTEEQGM